MADGSITNSGGVFRYLHRPDYRLRDLTAHHALWGSCNCGWEGSVDMAIWRGAEELTLHVSTAARRLRCTGCGGRDVVLEVRQALPSPGPSAFQRWR